jgi:hypothetical protein
MVGVAVGNIAVAVGEVLGGRDAALIQPATESVYESVFPACEGAERGVDLRMR